MATRTKIVEDLRKEFKKTLALGGEDISNDLIRSAMEEPLFGVLTMRFHFVGPHKLVITGSGFELLRMRYAAALSKDKEGDYIMPFTITEPIVIPSTDKSKTYDSKYVIGYTYNLRNDDDIQHVWAFFKAVKAVNLLIKATIRSPNMLDKDVGVIGVDIPYDEPEWVTAIAKGHVQKNPMRTARGAWYFGEQGTSKADFEKAFRKLHALQGAANACFQKINKYEADEDTIPAPKELKRWWAKYWPIRNTARRMIPTIAIISFNKHARTFVYDGDKTVNVIDPWQQPADYENTPAFKRVVDSFRNGKGWNVVPLALPVSDQELEGSCGVAALARTLWIAHKGREVMLQHPIPPDYAVLAKRLLVKNKGVHDQFTATTKINYLSIAENEAPQLPTATRRTSLSPGLLSSSSSPHAIVTASILQGATLKPHQLRVLKYVAYQNPRGLCLFHTVGSGKTITAIALAVYMLASGRVKNVIIAAPTSVAPQFYREVLRFAPPTLLSYIDVVTHDKIVKTGADVIKESTMLIVDEAHNFKNIGKTRTDSLLFSTKRAACVLMLSATPIVDKPGDLAPMIAMMRGSEREELATITNELERGVLTDKYIKCLFSIYKTRQASDDYPSYTEKYVPIPMDPAYYAAYVNIQNNKLGNADISDKKKLNVFLSGTRMASNTIGDKMSAKLLWAIERIKHDSNNARKVLIYSQFLDTGIKIIQDELMLAGISFGVVDGTANVAQRKLAVEQYNSGMLNVMIITMAGAEGIDLKGTRTVLVLEPWFNAGKTQQIVGRAVRYRSHFHLPAAERHVDIFYLVLQKPRVRLSYDKLHLSVDEYLYRISEEKDKAVDGIYRQLANASIEKCQIKPIQS